MKKYITKEYITGREIKKLREQLEITQKEFAGLVNCSVPTVERWECSDKKITGPIVLAVMLLEENLKFEQQLQIPEQKHPVRMWYMYRDKVCTLIDIDERERQVFIKNYTNKIMFRAFGKMENPSYEEYEEWLESRCFPRERDKMKLMLRELDIPFYDPMLIVSKTEGRMAEDDFWIRIER